MKTNNKIPKSNPFHGMKCNFSTFKALHHEIEEVRQYNDIKGLSAWISEKDYYSMLEALPPIYLEDGGWLLSECLSENLYYYFNSIKISSDKRVYFCCVYDKYELLKAQKEQKRREYVAIETNTPLNVVTK